MQKYVLLAGIIRMVHRTVPTLVFQVVAIESLLRAP
jgi:hypothetical protein